MLVTDIETDGLLKQTKRFHCGVTYDYDTDYEKFTPDELSGYLDLLEEVVAKDGLIVFHNGTKFDTKALTKLAKLQLNRDFELPKRNCLDTLVISRLLHANLKNTDAPLLRKGILPGKRYGSHALEAWGYRLGVLKGEYKDDYKREVEAQGEEYHEGDEWLHFNQAMLDYNVQDVVVTKALLEKFLQDSWYFPVNDGEDWTVYTTMTATEFWSRVNYSVTLEHDAAWLLAKMELNGFPFDTESIEGHYAKWSALREKLLAKLVDTFGSWYRPKGGNTPFRHPKTGKPMKKYPLVKYPKAGSVLTKAGKPSKTPYVKDCPYTPVEYVTFNPSSRDHIQLKLQEAGWVPTEFTPTGQPAVDDTVLEHVKVDDPEKQASIDLIKDYLLIQKRIGQAAEGDKAWLRYVEEDGRMHGSVNPNGAVTGRATHSFPNVAQVPSVRAPYGEECRKAFGAEHNRKPDGTKDPWVQAGIDASGLELRCLAHFMARFDNGEYAHEILNGDIHTKNQNAAELPTRDNAKTFIYGFLYGAGDEKIGQIVGAGKERGKELKAKFLENTPAIAALRESIEQTLVKSSKWVRNADGTSEQKVSWKRRWVKGLDGRKVHVRSPHAALNTLLQSAGALICKQWIVTTEEMLLAKGLKHGWDGDFAYMAWVHDEIQVACRNEAIAKIVVETAQEAMRKVGEMFNFRCQLDTEGKIGANWCDCH